MYGLASVTTLPSEDLDRIIEMAWEDRTPFEAIEFQFGLSEPQVIGDAATDESVIVQALAQAGERPQNQTRRHQPLRSVPGELSQVIGACFGSQQNAPQDPFNKTSRIHAPGELVGALR